MGWPALEPSWLALARCRDGPGGKGSTVDKREAQQQGADDRAAGRPSKDQEMILANADWEVVIMYAHGYFREHAACTCDVNLGRRNINAQVLAADGELAP
jgi:hypothetical protein